MSLTINNPIPLSQQDPTALANTSGNSAANKVNSAKLPAEFQNAQPTRGQKIANVLKSMFTFGIYGIVKTCREVDAMLAAVPPAPCPEASPRVDAANTALSSAVSAEKTLPPNLNAAMKEAASSLRAKFDMPAESPDGAGAMPKDFSAKLSARIKGEKSEVTPERLKVLAEGIARQGFAAMKMDSHIQIILDEIGFQGSPSDVYPHGSSEENFGARLNECRNAQDVQALFTEFADTIRTGALTMQAVGNAKQEVLADSYAMLSAATGISVETLQSSGVLSKAEGKFAHLSEALRELHPLPSADDMKSRFFALSEGIVRDKIAQYNSIDTLNISDERKAEWQNIALTNGALTKPDFFTKAVESAKSIDVSGLISALNEPAGTVSNDDIFVMLQSAGMNVEQGMRASYGDSYAAMNTDPALRDNARSFSAVALLEANPELAAALKANPERLQSLANKGVDFIAKGGVTELTAGTSIVHHLLFSLPPTTEQAKANLADSLGNSARLPVQYADTLNNVVRSTLTHFGQNSLGKDALPAHISPENATIADLSQTPTGAKLTAALATAIKGAEYVMTPQECREIFMGIVRGESFRNAITDDILRGMAQEANMSLSDRGISAARRLIFIRHPDLPETLGGLASRDAVKAQISGLEDSKGVLTMFAALEKSTGAGREKAVQRLAEATGKDAAWVNEHLDVRNLYKTFDEAVIGFRRATIPASTDAEKSTQLRSLLSLGLVDRMGDANSIVATEAEVQAKIDARIESFVASKVEQYNAIADLKGPANTPISESLTTRLQEYVFINPALQSVDTLKKAAEMSQKIDVASLQNALSSGDAGDTQGAFFALGIQIEAAGSKAFGQEAYARLDVPAKQTIEGIAHGVLLDTQPNLLAAIKANAANANSAIHGLESRAGRLNAQLAQNANALAQIREQFYSAIDGKAALHAALSGNEELKGALRSSSKFKALLNADNAREQLGSDEAQTQLLEMRDMFIKLERAETSDRNARLEADATRNALNVLYSALPRNAANAANAA